MTSKKKQILEKLINIFLNILIFIFGVFLLISIYNNIQINILGNDYSSFFGYSMFEVQTGSMKKAINPGDMIVVKSEPDIKLNDIITYKEGSEFITHRVIEVYNETYVTQGDANNTKDKPITKNQVVGKVIKVLPKFGIIRRILFNPFVLIALIITLYLISSMFGRGKNMKIKEFLLKIINKLKEKLESSEEEKKSFSIESNKKPIILKNEVIEDISIKEVQNIEPEREEETLLAKDAKEILEKSSQEDLDKTIFFRMVSVDKKDLESDFKPDVSEEIEEEEPKKSIKPAKKEIDTNEKLEEVARAKLELLNKKRKKCKNIIEKIMLLKTDELEEIIKELNFHREYKTNEPSIKEYFLKIYIDGKYYNFCGNVNVSYDTRNMVSKIEKLMEQTGEYLKKNYKGKDSKFAEKVDKFIKIFSLLPFLEKNASSDVKTKRETFKKKIYQTLKKEYISEVEATKVAEEIIKTQKIYINARKYLLEKLDTNTFKIKYTKIKEEKMYGVDLDHNINFSKIYSNYIVDKTYQEGIVAEDKVFVLANMLLIEIAKDMLESDFSKKYLLYIPESLYEKEVKLNQLFDLLNDEYAKYAIRVLVKYDEIDGNKTIIKNLIKEGFQFILSIDNHDILKEKDMKFIYIMDKIILNEKKETSKILKTLPKDLKEKCLFDDIAIKIAKKGEE